MGSKFTAFATGVFSEANDVNKEQRVKNNAIDAWNQQQQSALTYDNIKTGSEEMRKAKAQAAKIDAAGEGWDNRYGSDVGLQLRQAATSNPKLLEDPVLADKVGIQLKSQGVKSQPFVDTSTDSRTFDNDSDARMGGAAGMTPSQFYSARSGDFVPATKRYVSNPMSPDYTAIETADDDKKLNQQIKLVNAREQAEARYRAPSQAGKQTAELNGVADSYVNDLNDKQAKELNGRKQSSVESARKAAEVTAAGEFDKAHMGDIQKAAEGAWQKSPLARQPEGRPLMEAKQKFFNSFATQLEQNPDYVEHKQAFVSRRVDSTFDPSKVQVDTKIRDDNGNEVGDLTIPYTYTNAPYDPDVVAQGRSPAQQEILMNLMAKRKQRAAQGAKADKAINDAGGQGKRKAAPKGGYNVDDN